MKIFLTLHRLTTFLENALQQLEGFKTEGEAALRGARELNLLQNMMTKVLSEIEDAMKIGRLRDENSFGLLELIVKAREGIERIFEKIGGDSELMTAADAISDQELERMRENLKLVDTLPEMLLSLQKALSELPAHTGIVLPPLPKARGSDSDAARYSYSALPADYIRLIKLISRGEREDVLELSFAVVPLDENPRYDALSYTWGKSCLVFRTVEELNIMERVNVPVLLDGKVLEIGENLYRFLSRWQQALSIDQDDERIVRAESAGLATPEYMWIDAICINQKDNSERSSQVALMGRIYSQCQNTYAWLGEEDSFSRIALKTLANINGLIGKFDALESQKYKPREICEMLGLPAIESWTWICVFAFLNRAWFRRSWIIQEVALAPHVKVQCGSLSFPWKSLTNARGFILKSGLGKELNAYAWMELYGPGLQLSWSQDAHGDEDAAPEPVLQEIERPISLRRLVWDEKYDMSFVDTYLGTMAYIRNSDFKLLLHDYGNVEGLEEYSMTLSTTILNLFQYARVTNCFDPRDKVYSFIYLSEKIAFQNEVVHPLRRPLKANYDLQTEDVFLDAAWHILLSGQDLKILSCIEPAPRKHEFQKVRKITPALQSWVPDWNILSRSNALQAVLQAYSTDWSSAGHELWNVPLNPLMLYQPELPVKGGLIGIVDAVAIERDFLSDCELASELPMEYNWHNPPQKLPEVFWRTLILDIAGNKCPSPLIYRSSFYRYTIKYLKKIYGEYANDNYGGKGEERWDRMVSAGKKFVDQQDRDFIEGEDALDLEFENRVGESGHARKLFRTENGYLGMGPLGMQKGDRAFVLAGADVPFILREDPAVSGMFKTLGEAYVHGIMFGEALGRDGFLWEDILLI
ncbi:hypothetical protein HYFRA_00012387 [Hymenoscyphus fraxineus]|uniref:Heterokaryon incompatibility domain-containing protein n=1 Tax=Hymenoscyphus fraxineus TaxID=746836 RepID=A0A9N9L986_9HELO|nr:hypothetical protein HYFRA_00012387 [Hymenoscyphus fraxineus]